MPIPKEFNLGKIEIKELNNSFDLNGFDCGDSELNDYIKQQAIHDQNNNLGQTYVCIFDSHVIGYFTLSTHAFKMHIEDRKIFCEKGGHKSKYPEYPSLKVGRFARHIDYYGARLGGYMMKFIVGHAQKIGGLAGCRFITVDSYPKKESYYKRYNFKRIEPNKTYEKGETIPMWVDINQIRFF